LVERYETTDPLKQHNSDQAVTLLSGLSGL